MTEKMTPWKTNALGTRSTGKQPTGSAAPLMPLHFKCKLRDQKTQNNNKNKPTPHYR